MDIKEIEKSISDYTTYLAHNKSTQCQRNILLALEDKEVQTHIINHLNNNEIFIKCKCLPETNYNEGRIIFQFQQINVGISIIQPAFLVRINLANKKVIEIIEPYVDEFVFNEMIEDFSSVDPQITKSVDEFTGELRFHSSGYFRGSGNPIVVKAGHEISLGFSPSFPVNDVGLYYVQLWTTGYNREYRPPIPYVIRASVPLEDPIYWSIYVRTSIAVQYNLYSTWIPGDPE